jgi:hypothetical protein
MEGRLGVLFSFREADMWEYQVLAADVAILIIGLVTLACAGFVLHRLVSLFFRENDHG